MTRPTEVLAERLARLAMPMRGQTLARAEALLRHRGHGPETPDDLQLMAICVEAYREPESDLPAWV